MARPETLQEALPGFWNMVRYFWRYLRKHSSLMAGSFLALIAEVVLRLLEPWPLKFVFDTIFATPGASGSSTLPFAGTLGPLVVLTLAAIAMVVVASLRALTAYASTIGFALIGNRVLTEVRGDLYQHLQRLPLAYHERTRSGDMTMRVISDVGMVRDVAVTALLPMVGNVLILLGMMAVMFWLHWKLALVAIAVTPLFWIRSVRLGKQIQKVSRQQRRREGALAATAAESLSAIRVVQALSLEGVFARAFSMQNARSYKEGLKAKRLEANLERSVDALVAFATALVAWYGGWLVLRQELTPGDLIVFLTYLKNAFKPARDFAKYTGRIAKATAAGERILDVLQTEPSIQNTPGSVPAPAFEGVVRFEEVTFGYELGRSVLKRVSFEARPGQRVALVGPSGVGKSTLTSLILRLYDPTIGRVRIDGRDIRDYTMESLRSQISVVLQDNLLFAASIHDNIAYGAADVTRDEVEATARLANAHDFITALPEGYDTILGERGVTLSGGQRQRIAIARAAIRRCPIVILDEPTTGLDEENQRVVADALRRLGQGATTFLITHDLQLVSDADLILYLEDGWIVERGTHEELMASGGRYAAMYRLQSTVHRRNSSEDAVYALAG